MSRTRASIALLPMPSALEPVLRDYLMRWEPNPKGLLFASPRDPWRPRSRDNVVKNGLKPCLRKLGLPTPDCGLHAFRHGLATELTDNGVPITAVQSQMRHADIRTTLKIYAHAIPHTQREAMESVRLQSISTVSSTAQKFAAK